MTSRVTVRRAEAGDVPWMARVHVTSWQETYRGSMPDSVLDDPALPAIRERFWTAALTDERWSANRAAVAEADGRIIGIAMSGPPEEPGAVEDRQLHLIYVEALHHGSGAGPALLDAVLDPRQSAVWWVAERNPRTQAFMRKHGFAPDGRTQTQDGIRAVRWIRRAGQPQRRDDGSEEPLGSPPHRDLTSST